MKSFSEEEIRFIRAAAAYLEFPTWVQKVTQLVGRPIEMTLERLPERARDLVGQASRKAMDSALKTALGTLTPTIAPATFSRSLELSRATGRMHGMGTALTGAVGGLFGLPALPLELPMSTLVMLRSISRIAVDFGHDPSARATQLDCLYVFSLGGPGPGERIEEATYYSTRLATAELLEKALTFVGARTAREIVRALDRHSAPALVEFVSRIASRFELVVGRKTLAQLIPGIGAGAGALINLAFTEHFNQVARFHFGLKRLERERGEAEVRRCYENELKTLRDEQRHRS